MVATYVAPNSGEQLLIKLGDGGGPEVFAQPALVNADRALKMSTSEVAVEIPRTDNPSAPAKTVRQVTATDWEVTVSGIMNNGDDKTWADWLMSGVAKNIKVVNNATGALTLTGPALCTDFNPTGKRGGKVEFQATLKGADLPTTSASA